MDRDASQTRLPASAATTGRHIVKFNDVGLGLAAVRASGASIVHDLTAKHQAVSASIPAGALIGLQNNPHIDYVEPDYVRRPFAQEVPFGIDMVQANPATGGLSYAGAAAIKVCIIDTGYDLGHEDLPLNVTSAPHPATGANTGDPLQDGYGHGTHVAGTIAGLSNGVGVAGVMAGGNVDLHIIKIFGQDGLWVTGVSDLIVAVDQCRAAGAKVINMSLGGGGASTLENNAFEAAYAAGVLSIAAAGNDQETTPNALSYPASYGSVVSVAAVDSAGNIGSFSQQNAAVELAAPGVGVLSTIPTGHGIATTLAVAGADVAAEPMDGSPNGDVTGALVDCGLGDAGATRARGRTPGSPGACVGAGGKVCLIARGTISFSDKVLNCQNGGGIGAVIYNNVAGEPLYGTLGGVATSIPSVGVTQAAGQAMSAGQSAHLFTGPSGYDYAAWNGTSMATPHVVGVAALVWSHDPTWTNAQVRAALTSTASDLGAGGRDNVYGYGLVQAQDALCALDPSTCPPPCVPACADQCGSADGCGGLCDADVAVCGLCGNGTPACENDGQCAAGDVCAGSGCEKECLACVPSCGADLCGGSDGCGGTCDASDVDTCGSCGNATPECVSDAGCPTGWTCDGTGCDATCAGVPQGGSCSSDSQCTGNKCKGGRCR